MGLNEPKLTHVVLDKRDDSRRVELMKRTSKYVASNRERDSGLIRPIPFQGLVGGI